jgi:cell division protease FtsH
MLIQSGEAKAKKILAKYRKALHDVAKNLIEFETLNGEEVKLVMAGKKIIRIDDDKPKAEPPAPVVPRTSGKSRSVTSLEPQTQS